MPHFTNTHARTHAHTHTHTHTQVVSKHPLEANLAGCNLEKVPKYYFLNSNLIALNLSHNFMQVELLAATYS